MLQKIGKLQSEMKNIRLQEKVGEENYHYETLKLFEPVSKTNEDKIEKKTQRG